jgi:Flp pilus assembly protein TadG
MSCIRLFYLIRSATHSRKTLMNHSRRGAVLPLIALILPVLLMLSAFAVNLAYVQLTRTQLRVATDAAARAAGRALSEFQSVDSAIDFAVSTAALNEVAGSPLQISDVDEADVQFGVSARSDGGYGRYVFNQTDIADLRSGSAIATAVRVMGRRTASSGSGAIQLLFNGVGENRVFQPVASAVATQVDRDIALILDRSGSMAEAAIDYSQYYHTEWQYRNRRWRQVTVWDDQDKRQEYEEFLDQYSDWQYDNGPAPDASRWAALVDAVDEFLVVLEATDQEELVSVATFNSAATLDLSLQETYGEIRTLLGNTRPGGYTSIGQGMETGLPSLYETIARNFAAKTIVILTDGINNTNPTPESAAQDIVEEYNITIHTVTFTDEADFDAMDEVAQIGGGKHFHADAPEELIEIFREIANNLPTIITE